MLFNCGVGEDSWESLGLQDQICPSWRKSTLSIHWKDWCWSSNTLATWCKEQTHWKRPWCWERLKARRRRGWQRTRWHHRLNGHEFEQALGDGEGQGILMCCSPWHHKEPETTEQLNTHSIKIHASGFSELFEKTFCVLMVVEELSLQKVV